MLERDDTFGPGMDLVISLSAVLLILLAVATKHYTNASNKLAEAERVSRSLPEMVERNKVLTRLEQNHAAIKSMLERIQRGMKSQGFESELVEDTRVLRLPNDLLFDVGRCNSDRGEIALARLAMLLDQELPCYASGVVARRRCESDAAPVLEAVLIEGHADSREVKKGGQEASCRYSDNLELSTLRAAATYRALTEKQPALANLRNTSNEPLFGLGGYGALRPLKDTDPEDAKNRRTDIRFMISTLSGSGAP